jgi:type II secretory pathway component PulK
MERPRTSSESARRAGFAAVVALLFLASTAAMVLMATRGRETETQLELLAVQTERARLAALAGEALARSAIRSGLEADEVRVDPSLGLITIEERDEEGETVWVIRAESGVAARERRVRP